MTEVPVSAQTIRDRIALAAQLDGKESEVAAALTHLSALIPNGPPHTTLWKLALHIAERFHLSPPARLARRQRSALADWYLRRAPFVLSCTSLQDVFGQLEATTPVTRSAADPSAPGDQPDPTDATDDSSDARVAGGDPTQEEERQTDHEGESGSDESDFGIGMDIEGSGEIGMDAEYF
jgi:hypothetical protein